MLNAFRLWPNVAPQAVDFKVAFLARVATSCPTLPLWTDRDGNSGQRELAHRDNLCRLSSPYSWQDRTVLVQLQAVIGWLATKSRINNLGPSPGSGSLTGSWYSARTWVCMSLATWVLRSAPSAAARRAPCSVDAPGSWANSAPGSARGQNATRWSPASALVTSRRHCHCTRW